MLGNRTSSRCLGCSRASRVAPPPDGSFVRVWRRKDDGKRLVSPLWQTLPVSVLTADIRRSAVVQGIADDDGGNDGGNDGDDDMRLYACS